MQQDWKGLGSFGTVGLEFSLSILVGLYFGTKLDEWLGTGPWLTLLWAAIGLAAGTRALIRAGRAATRAAEKLEEEERQQRKRYHEPHQRDRQERD